jgi:hypothetical protein
MDLILRRYAISLGSPQMLSELGRREKLIWTSVQHYYCGIFEQIREVMFLQGSLSIERMCQLVPVSRRSFYRSLKEQRPAEEVTAVRSVIQQIASSESSVGQVGQFRAP